MRERLRYFGGYIRRTRKAIVLFAAFSVTFFVVFRLSGVDLEAALYATLLCGVIGLLALIIDSAFYITRVRKLQKLLPSALLSADLLDAPRDLTEEAYQELVRRVIAEYEKEKAENAGKRIDLLDYYSAWVHQIKSPIAAMRLILQREEREDKDPLLTELFRIEQYVDMALQYTRLESISSDLTLRRIDLVPVIRQTIRKFAPVFIGKKITLDLPDFSLWVVSDEKWIAVVLDQIVSNALKYTASGRIAIYPSADNASVVVIRDTGIGIRPEDLPRVFERGFTGANGRADKRATGIGLYLAKKIMDRLSHEIRIESDGKSGTSVFLDFSQNLTQLQD